MTAVTYISKVISTVIKSGFRYVKVSLLGGSREPYEAMPYGVDSNPVKDMDAIYAPTSINGIPVIIGYLNKNQLSAVGDMRTYATDTDGAFKFNIWQKNDGTCLIGTSVTPADYVDNFVKYTPLNTAIQSDIVTFMNAQLALIAAGIAAGGGSYTPGTMSVNITSSKITTVKTT